MMLDHLGEAEAAALILKAMTDVLSAQSAPRTPDMGGLAKTSDVGTAIAKALTSGI